MLKSNTEDYEYMIIGGQRYRRGLKSGTLWIHSYTKANIYTPYRDVSTWTLVGKGSESEIPYIDYSSLEPAIPYASLPRK
jgi:hypothetical protein